MIVRLGPYPIDRIVLCSADAGPKSQSDNSAEARYFFTRASWVGAVRNTAEDLGCKFVILTTAHGMVNSEDMINPYDTHIGTYRSEVDAQWQQTIPHVLGTHQYGLIVFYAGGCPRDLYLDLLMPILRNAGISLITFGKPNMYDVGKLEEFTKLIVKGTTIKELESILKYPDELEFIPVFS